MAHLGAAGKLEGYVAPLSPKTNLKRRASLHELGDASQVSQRAIRARNR
jgi:hypothetical protein